jgi:hypothetical protein
MAPKKAVEVERVVEDDDDAAAGRNTELAVGGGLATRA